MTYTVIDGECREISDKSYGHFRLPETDDSIERDFGSLDWNEKEQKIKLTERRRRRNRKGGEKEGEKKRRKKDEKEGRMTNK